MSFKALDPLLACTTYVDRVHPLQFPGYLYAGFIVLGDYCLFCQRLLDPLKVWLVAQPSELQRQSLFTDRLPITLPIAWLTQSART
jgi:hypothetical protein